MMYIFISFPYLLLIICGIHFSNDHYSMMPYMIGSSWVLSPEDVRGEWFDL